MVRSTAVLRLALAAVAAGSLAAPALRAQEPSVSAESRAQDDELYTAEELDNLLAPIALYPDPILAQLFVAATYPDQIQLAQRYVEAYGTDDVDDQAWDLSVRSIAHYEPVLNMLAERPNWATAVGRAYALQSGDVMASVQGLRRMAREQGNLASTEQQRVIVEREVIRIVPAQPRVIYVPTYDPYVVYYRPVNYVRVATPYWSFGVAFPIGAWLAYDCDWDTRVVYYHGWNAYGYRYSWYHVSRPYIAYNAVYFGGHRGRYLYDANIVRRRVNYVGFGHYNTVHRTVRWDRDRIPGAGYGRPAKGSDDRFGLPRGDRMGDRPEKVGSMVPRAGDGRGTMSGRPGRGSEDRGNGSGRAGEDRGRGSAGYGRPGNAGTATSASRVPSVGRAPSSGGREERGGRDERGGRVTTGGERISPVRIGGSRRAPVDEDPVRVPRGSDRIAPATGSRESSPRAEVPRSSSRDWSRSAPSRSESPRSESPRSESSRSSTRREAPSYDAPRSAPRATERSAPRATERSAPRASSAPRVSAPRSSAPRASTPSASRGGGGGVPRAPKRDRN